MDIERNDNYASGYAPGSRPYSYTETNSSGDVLERGTISGCGELAYLPDGKWAMVLVLIANAMFNGTSLSFAPNHKEGV